MIKETVEFSMFKKENLLFKHAGVHFISKDFRYFVNNKRIQSFLINTSAINFVAFIGFFLMGIVALIRYPSPVIAIFIIPMLIFGGLVNLSPFFDYYRYMKRKTLILAKGSESFWYGDIDNLTQYNKKDIIGVTIVSSRNPRSSKDGLWSGFAVYKIHLSNAVYPIAFTSFYYPNNPL